MNKMWKTQAKAIGIPLLKVLLCVLLLLSFLLTILSFAAKSAIGDREDYRRPMRDPAVIEMLLEDARKDLEAECLFYGLPFDIIDASLSEEDAKQFSADYIDAVYDAVFVSGELQAPSVDAALFRDAIAAQLAEEEVEDTIIDELSAEFAAVTTAVWRLGITQKLLNPIHRIATHPLVLRFQNSGWILAAVTALLLAANLVLDGKRIRRRTYTLAGLLTGCSMVLFVPVWLLHRYQIAEKLVLGDGPLRLFVMQWTNNVTERLFTLTLWVMIACAALTLLSVIWVVWPTKQQAEDIQE